MKIRDLVGAGDRIGLVTAPVIVVGVIANIAMPTIFSVGGPPEPWRVVSGIVLVAGLVMWLWSVVLILTRVPQHRLITSGPYAIVRHPLYTSVALLVLPWVGFLLDTWLGALIGVVLYGASRLFAPREEEDLTRAFGAAWQQYRDSILIPWL